MIETKEILVDTREQELLKIINSHTEKYRSFTPKFLEVGDLVFLTSSVCCERKEIIDMYNSIVNGRIFEQVLNMKQNFQYNFVIIVGNFKKCYDCIPFFNENILLGAIASLTVKYNVNVLMVDNNLQLLDLFERICSKITKPIKNNNVIKRRDYSGNDIYLNMLTCIPSISIERAKLILKHHTFQELFSVNEEKLMELSGIGPKIARKIKEFLCEKPVPL